jgi:hypothetical protein
VSGPGTRLSLVMAATSETSIADKMHLLKKQGTRACQPSDIGFLIKTTGTSAASLVDKIHYCKTMERERVRLQISAF